VATLALVACGGDDGSTASALDATGRAQALDACASCANRVNNTFDRLLSTAAGTPSMRRRPHRAAVVRWWPMGAMPRTSPSSRTTGRSRRWRWPSGVDLAPTPWAPLHGASDPPAQVLRLPTTTALPVPTHIFRSR